LPGAIAKEGTGAGATRGQASSEAPEGQAVQVKQLLLIQ